MDSANLAVLRSIYRAQPVTRRELGRQLGLSPGRVSMLVGQLLDRGLVREEVRQGGNPGRPAALLSVNPDAGRVVGVDVSNAYSRIVLSDLAGGILASVAQPTEMVPQREAILENLTALVVNVCREGGLAPGSLAAMGIGLQAIVDARGGAVLDWPTAPSWAAAWRGLDISAELGRRLGIKVTIVEDSVRAMGISAHRSGPARGSSCFLYVFLGSGIGSVLVVDGQPYRGAIGLAGELGHITVTEEGPLCSCGNRGCLETIASTSAILRRVGERLAEPHLVSALREPYARGMLTLWTLFEAARAGDKLAFQILDETGAYVGRVIAIALNLLAPDLVVLGGPLAQDGGIVLEAVQRQVRLRALQHISRQTRIVCDDQGEWAGAQGAALLALDALFV